MYDETLTSLISAGCRRMESELLRASPATARRVESWLGQLSESGRLEDYFTDPHAFPMLLLPWWVARTVEREPDIAFHSNIVYSTMNGYCYIRLVDNVMDGHDKQERGLLPATAFFHSQFQQSYYRYFESTSPFWDTFHTLWLKAGDAVMEEATLTNIDRRDFDEISASKLCGAKIPVVAVCHWNGRPDLVGPWSECCDRLARVMQFMDDLFDWHRDLSRGITSYFLSQAASRKRNDESATSWIVREGFAWGVGILRTWLDDLRPLAHQLGSGEFEHYLERRQDILRDEAESIERGLCDLISLAPIVG
jgi:hypothetical protein